jgi:hypothetical protein
MKYFGALPLLLNTDSNNNILTMRNILIRTNLVNELQKNPLLLNNFYS